MVHTEVNTLTPRIMPVRTVDAALNDLFRFKRGTFQNFGMKITLRRK